MRRAWCGSSAAGAVLALALALNASATVAWAQSETKSGAAVPVPDSPSPPPPANKDVTPAPGPSAAPTKAADATKPAEASKPAEPPKAAAASKPAEPLKAAEPAKPVEPTKAAETSKPAEPARMDEKAIDAAIPVPETAELPPPSVKDIGPVPAPAAPKDAAVPAPNAPAAAAAAPATPAVDTAVADKLRDFISGKFDFRIAGKKERASVESFYQKRDYAPLWVANGALNDRAKAAIAYLAGVAADGLDPADYPAPSLAVGADLDAQVAAEIALTESVLTFAHHAQVGRVSYTRISGDIAYHQVESEPADVLAKLAEAKLVGAALDSFNPQQPGYKALKAKLAELRKGPAAAEPKRVRITEGPILRPGMNDPRVIDVRKRLDIPGDPNSQVYDDAVFQAVKKFQRAEELGADGMLGANTIRALNGQHRRPSNTVDTIVANMERWRWMPHDLGKTYVMVNIPDFTLRVVNDGKLVWKTKIVVGKPSKETPLTTADMKFITVNPTWNVPPSIVQNEYLPVLKEDPGALARAGIKVVQDRDGTVHMFQPPGDRNALGRIRFNFPNKFLVYQHDTPDKYLFAKDKRAYSHGCMRVENPLKYGEVLLSLLEPDKGYTQERLRKMFGGSEININFPHPIPVHLTYQTAFVDHNGKLELREDLYGLDARILAILKGDQRRVADIPIERHDTSSAKSVRLPIGAIAGSEGARPANFFDWLFGNAQAEEEAPPPRARHFRRRSARN